MNVICFQTAKEKAEVKKTLQETEELYKITLKYPDETEKEFLARKEEKLRKQKNESILRDLKAKKTKPS
jgi:hypothetical protein